MPDLLYDKRDRFAVFTMNRPERLNALGGTMMSDLTEALADFNADPEMRAGILTGTGRAFSAGADLKEMNQRNVDRGDSAAPIRSFDPASSLPFSRSPKPIIAAINGLCIAGGLERALDCDIRICSTEAWFGLFEVKRGILAGYAIHHLARLVPFSDAMYILLTGDRVEPDDAPPHGPRARGARSRRVDAPRRGHRRHDRGECAPLGRGQQVHGPAVAAAHDR